MMLGSETAVPMDRNICMLAGLFDVHDNMVHQTAQDGHVILGSRLRRMPEGRDVLRHPADAIDVNIT